MLGYRMYNLWNIFDLKILKHVFDYLIYGLCVSYNADMAHMVTNTNKESDCLKKVSKKKYIFQKKVFWQ